MLATACGRIDFDPIAPCTGLWGQPAALMSLNTADDDWEPAISPDGQTMVFGRRHAAMLSDIYVSRLVSGTFSTPVLDSNLSTAGDNVGPAWNADGTELYTSTNPGSGYRLGVSTFDGVAFTTPTPVPELATEDIGGAALSPDQLELYYNNQLQPFAIRRARRASTTAPWVVEGIVSELRSATNDGFPTLSPDGLTIYFESDRDGNAKIYSAVRPTLGAPFGSPVRFDPANVGLAKTGDPDVSADGATMFFAGHRADDVDLADLYMIAQCS
jgi:hypothetical protein